MALDTLEIFGDEFTNVTGIKATDDQDNVLTYIRPQGTVNITSAGNTDVTNYATATVPSAVPFVGDASNYYTSSGQRKWNHIFEVAVDTSEGDVAGWLPDGYSQYREYTCNAIPTGTTVTPTETAQTIGGASTMMEGAVTVEAISSDYVGSAINRYDSSDLTVSGATVSGSGGYYANAFSKSVASGTEGTPTATKGNVSNHAISVTPSVTNSAGYISGGTKTGTAVTVSASELVSGNLPITQNGNNIDVTNYATVSVNVSGGGGSSVAMGNGYNDAGGDRTSIVFDSVLGEPTSFIVYANNGITLPSGTPYKISAVVYDGTSYHAQTLTNTSNAQASYDSSGFSHTYSNGVLTITSTGAHFVDADWVLLYSYGGSTANIHTSDVQVGSGATSITFTDLEDEPIGWYCIFKGNFGTSSGYQRVICASLNSSGTDIEGLCMDSQARYSSSYWSSSYNNGSLTITSQGTNAGGYFHQPGYYQLTYVVADASPYQKISKTYSATTSTQTEKIEPSTGYDAIAEVNVTVDPISQTNLIASNIKDGTTVTISNGNTNIYSVTGTYSGGGGGSLSYDTKTATASDYPTSLSFTSMKGEPKFFAVRLNAQVSSSGSTTYYYIVDIVSDCNGSSATTHGNCFRIGSTRRVDNITSGYSYSYSGTTLTITSSAGSRSASPGAFYSGSYELIYAY